MNVRAEIITIGDELLIGQVIDTNSAWIAQQLNDIGIKVAQITSISDNEQHILTTLDEARERASIILITGGLGPTKDDITKLTLCKYFNCGLRFDEEAFKYVEKIFKARGREVTEINRKQAELPEACEAIQNEKGTASGMWFKVEDHIIISMPGVPYEMKDMMEKTILPRLQSLFTSGAIYHKTIMLQGIGESFLSDMIEQWELNLPANIRLAYLPSPGIVRLRLSAMGENSKVLEKQVEEEIQKLIPIADEFIFGYNNDTLEKLVGEKLKESKATLSTAESCTGGYIAHKITSVAGSSAYFIGSIIAYSNQMKTDLLQVPQGILEKHGAVSEEVVIAMAQGIQKKLKTNYAIAVSGIAGPDGGTSEKPVGTVWLAITHPKGMFTKKLQLGSDRGRIILETSLHSLNNLRKLIP